MTGTHIWKVARLLDADALDLHAGAAVASKTEEMEDLMTHVTDRAHTGPAHLVACTTVDDLLIRCRTMDLEQW
jgi:hypothetical protein